MSALGLQHRLVVLLPFLLGLLPLLRLTLVGLGALLIVGKLFPFEPVWPTRQRHFCIQLLGKRGARQRDFGQRIRRYVARRVVDTRRRSNQAAERVSKNLNMGWPH